MPSLDSLLQASDVITLHVPETPQTHVMIGAEQLGRMKKGARLINAARGTVVDIDALTAALESGHLAGAAIDVFPIEPLPADHPIRRAPGAVLSAHRCEPSQFAGLGGIRMRFIEPRPPILDHP